MLIDKNDIGELNLYMKDNMKDNKNDSERVVCFGADIQLMKIMKQTGGKK
jgi:hypothetical protein